METDILCARYCVDSAGEDVSVDAATEEAEDHDHEEADETEENHDHEGDEEGDAAGENQHCHFHAGVEYAPRACDKWSLKTNML